MKLYWQKQVAGYSLSTPDLEYGKSIYHRITSERDHNWESFILSILKGLSLLCGFQKEELLIVLILLYYM